MLRSNDDILMATMKAGERRTSCNFLRILTFNRIYEESPITRTEVEKLFVSLDNAHENHLKDFSKFCTMSFLYEKKKHIKEEKKGIKLKI